MSSNQCSVIIKPLLDSAAQLERYQSKPTTVSTARQQGFTLVELLVVIVIIAILAAISVVIYSGVQDRARASVAKSDLSRSAKQLAQEKVVNGSYPADDGSGAPPSDIKASDGNSLEYTSDGDTFCLSATTGKQSFHIADGSSIQEGVCDGHSGAGSGDDDTPSVTIGSQTWMKHNLNVGTMVARTIDQTDNSVIEKYCYNDVEASCEEHGGLYQWTEAMQYSSKEGAQGICPTGWHIPTDAEWQALEVTLGMNQAVVSGTGWRGVSEGSQLKPGGSSALNFPLAGFRSSLGRFFNRRTDARLWTSSRSDGGVWRRYLNSGHTTVNRGTDSTISGYSVRCLKN